MFYNKKHYIIFFILEKLSSFAMKHFSADAQSIDPKRQLAVMDIVYITRFELKIHPHNQYVQTYNIYHSQFIVSYFLKNILQIHITFTVLTNIIK